MSGLPQDVHSVDDRPLGAMRLEPARAILCLRLLMEGTSIRSVERLTGVNRNTLMSPVVTVGEKCERFLAKQIVGMQVSDVQADEIWSFVKMKERTRERLNRGEENGDAWTFVAMERWTKMVLCWHLGKRVPLDTHEFAEKLMLAASGRFQLTTDGFTPYRVAIPTALGHRVDYATLVKVYASPRQEGQERYSPGTVVDTVATPCCGDPDPDRICTSHVERGNLNISYAWPFAA